MSDLSVDVDRRADAPATVAPFVALAIAVVLAGLFVVLAGADSSTDETADDAAARPAGTRGDRRAGRRRRRSISPGARASGSWSTSSSRLRAVPAGAPRPRRASPTSRPRSASTAPSCTPSCTTTPRPTSRSSSPPRVATGRSCSTTTGRSPSAFGVAKVPETWIIDPNGIVRGRIISRVRADGLGQPAPAAAGANRMRALKRWPGWVLLVFVVVGFLAVGATRGDGPSGPDERADVDRPARGLPDVRRRERLRVAEHGVGEHPQPHRRRWSTPGQASDDEIIAEIEASFGGPGAAGAAGHGPRRPGVGAAGRRADLRRRRPGGHVPPVAARAARRSRTRRPRTGRSWPPRWPPTP